MFKVHGSTIRQRLNSMVCLVRLPGESLFSIKRAAWLRSACVSERKHQIYGTINFGQMRPDRRCLAAMCDATVGKNQTNTKYQPRHLNTPWKTVVAQFELNLLHTSIVASPRQYPTHSFLLTPVVASLGQAVCSCSPKWFLNSLGSQDRMKWKKKQKNKTKTLIPIMNLNSSKW